MELNEEKKEKVIEYAKEGKPVETIAEELGCSKSDVLETAEMDSTISNLIDKGVQSKAFKMFEEGEKPVDLVKKEVCDIEEASLLFNKYNELKDMVGISEKTKLEKLSTQVGLMGSRMARVELKLNNSYLLPKTRKCSKCGHEGTYGVGVVCSKCGEIDVEMKDESSEKYMDTVQNLVKEKDDKEQEEEKEEE